MRQAQRRSRLVATMVGALLVALAADATALVLCERKRKVAARESCRANETPLSLVELGTPGGAGAEGPPGPAGPPPLRLVDAAGSDVGPVVSLRILITFISDADNPLIQAVVQRAPLSEAALIGAGIAGAPSGRVFYQSADCSGTPLVQGGIMAVLQVIGETVFAPIGAATVVLPVASREGNDASQGCLSITPRGGCCRAGVGSIQGATASATTLGALGIVPPLRAVAK